jgi:hypothetical protein
VNSAELLRYQRRPPVPMTAVSTRRMRSMPKQDFMGRVKRKVRGMPSA